MKTQRLKHVAQIRISNVDKKISLEHPRIRLCNYTDVYYNERINSAIDFMNATASEDQQRVFGLQLGDIVLTKDSETASDIGVSALIAEEIPDLVCGYHLAILRPNPSRCLGPYLRWALAGTPARDQMSAAATGVTRFGLRADAIAGLKLAIPPLSEQLALATYLDRETARIDALVASKQRVVTLLEERFTILREDVIQSVPATAVKLGRFVTTISQGVSPRAESRQADAGEWGVLKLSAVKRGRFAPSEHKALPPDIQPNPTLVPQVGDVLVTRANTPQLVGDTCAVTDSVSRLMLSDLIYVLRLRSDLQPEYAAQALLTSDARRQLSSLARGTSQSMVKLRGEDVKNTTIPLPTPESQQSIVHTLNTARTEMDVVVLQLERSIALLKERRQSLITAAVTGQLDIPEAV
jgi:type I restriction enzyme S subunit